MDKNIIIEKIFSELNDAQKKAVEYIDGPELVIACAGSGKTRVLTYKIAYLLALGYEPQRILAMTFTRKAAGEMKERIDKIHGSDISSSIMMGTFHSIFSRILRKEHNAAGLPPSFVIYDQTDSLNTVSDIMKELNINLLSVKPKDIQARISSLKNNKMYDAAAYLADDDAIAVDAVSGRECVRVVFQEYEKRLKRSGSVDFDDILLYTYNMFVNCPDVAEKWRNFFQYILVDEYQDTNTVQAKIVKILAGEYGRICVVGDDAQSIYAFRGAIIDNIIHFEKDFPTMQMFKLEENYRSTPDIISAANCVIGTNKKQIVKNVFTNNPSGDKVHIVELQDKFKEGDYIAQFISDDVKKDGRTYNDYTILYRMNSQSAQIETALRRSKIPYRIYGGVTFFSREEIKNLLAYLKLTVNSADDESFKRIFDYPARRIADVTLSVIQKEATKNSLSLFDTIDPESGCELVFANSGYNKRVIEFYNRIKSYSDFSKEHDIIETTRYIFSDSGMEAILKKDKTESGIERLENIGELITMEKKFIENNDGMLEDFLDEIAEVDADDDDMDDNPKVKMMTLHGSKGLEFDTVFILGCVEGTFPMVSSFNFTVDDEEECRLAYVGMTRAKKRLIMPVYNENYLWGKTSPAQKSRFIKAISDKYIVNESYGVSRNNRFDDYDFDDDFDDDYEEEPKYSKTTESEIDYLNKFSKKTLNEYINHYETFKDKSFNGFGQKNLKLLLNRRKKSDGFKAEFLRELIEAVSNDANVAKYYKRNSDDYLDGYVNSKNNSLNNILKILKEHNKNCAVEEKIKFGIYDYNNDSNMLWFELPFDVEHRVLAFHFTLYKFVKDNLDESDFSENSNTVDSLDKLDIIQEVISNEYKDAIQDKIEKGLVKKEKERQKFEEMRTAQIEEARKRREIQEKKREEQEKENKRRMEAIDASFDKIVKFLNESTSVDDNIFEEFSTDEILSLCLKCDKKYQKNYQTLCKIVIDNIKNYKNSLSAIYGIVDDTMTYKTNGKERFYIVGEDIPTLEVPYQISKNKSKIASKITKQQLSEVKPLAIFITALFKRCFKNKN